MALVKMIRDIPEVAGGKTEAMVSEEGVKDAMARGWIKAGDKVVTPEVEEEPKVEQVVEEKSEEPEEEKDFPKFEKNEEKKFEKNFRK